MKLPNSRPRAALRRRDARLIIVQVLVISLVATLFGRLAWLQLSDPASFRTAAASNSVRFVVLPAARGLIVDQAGRPIVANRSSLTVSVDRAELSRQDDDGEAVLTVLAAALSTTPDALRQRLKSCGTPGAPKQPLCWNGPSQQPAVVAEDLPQAVGLQLMERQAQLPGVRTELIPIRAYPHPYGVNAAHVVGYLGQRTAAEEDALAPDDPKAQNPDVGRSGLEQQYESALAGTPGIQQLAVSRSGQVTETIRDEQPVDGANVVTSIDAKLQSIVETQLAAAVTRARGQGFAADSGSMVVLDSNTGRVLSMASYPSYDPKVWVGGIDDATYQTLQDPDHGQPLINHVTQGTYSPASTFKVVSALAAMQGGYSTAATYPCPSAYQIGSQKFKNYESHAYGNISIAKALAVSCDTVFYGLADKEWQADGGIEPAGTPKELTVNAARSFGLGKATGIDIPGEASGRIVGRAEKTANYNERKADYCKRAADGYPEIQPPARAALLKSYAQDFCDNGGQYRVGDALNFSIGQGDTSVTPLQIASMYSAIANGGTLYQPQIVRAEVKRDGTVLRKMAPVSNGKVDASAAELSYLRAALADTAATGTAAGVFEGFPLSKISIAAKTGTGEVVGKAATGWLASFAPASAPKYTVVCMVSQGGTGSGSCGESVRKVYEALFGVTGTKVEPAKSVFGAGGPQAGIPVVNDDGMSNAFNSAPVAVPGDKIVSPTPTATAAPSATPTPTPTATPTPVPTPTPTPGGGESAPVVVTPKPSREGETPVSEPRAGPLAGRSP